MRQATDRGVFFRYWQDAVTDGVFGPVHADQPQGGFYRHKIKGPVAIWIDQEFEGDALSSPEEIKCLVGANGKAQLGGFDEACELWTYIAARPVSEEDYRKAWATGVWPGEDHGLPNTPADSFEELRDQIDSAVTLIGLFPPIETKEDADRVANARDRLNDLCQQAEAMRKAEKKPYDDGAKEVQAKYKPVLDLGAQAVAYCRTLLTPYLNKVAQRAAEALLGPGTEAEAVEAPKVRVGGASGRRTGLKTVTKVEIADYDVAWLATKDEPEVKQAVYAVGLRRAKAKVYTPGIKISTEKVAQ